MSYLGRQTKYKSWDFVDRDLNVEISLEELVKFLNEKAEAIEGLEISVKEKKQRYVIIIINALASTLCRKPDLQKEFLNKVKAQLDIDSLPWKTESSKIRHAGKNKSVSDEATKLRDKMSEQLNIPPENML